MFTKKLPRCASVAAITAIAVPTMVGTLIKLLSKSGDIVSAASQTKKSIDNIKKMATDLTEQMKHSSENTSDNITEEVNQV